MAKTGMKIPVISTAICIAALLAPICRAAAEAQPLAPPPRGLDSSGIYNLRQIDPNLTGIGVNFAVICRSITYDQGLPQNDYQPAADHKCLRNAALTFHHQPHLPPGTSAHATAVCSILLGQDPNAFETSLDQFYYQGAAPNANAQIYEFWYFLVNNVFPFSPPDADIITAGFGSPVDNWWSRGLCAMAQHHGITIVAGIGNGSDEFDSPLYPAAAANIIAVGVVDQVDSPDPETALEKTALAYPEHSTVGPTVEALSKPDIVAPGNYLAAHHTEPDLYEPTGSWSSFATPVVAGTAGLLIQKINDDPNLTAAVETANRNCLIKSLLLNSASKLPYWHKGLLHPDDDHTAPLDYLQGAGMLNPVAAYKNLTAGKYPPGTAPQTGWDLNSLRQNENIANSYTFTLEKPAEKFITATVVWNKNFQPKYPFSPLPEKDADLRLELWALDPDNPEKSYLLDYSDSPADPLEHIYCPADPNCTDYELIISYSKISDTDNPLSHPYALAWSLTDPPDPENILWYDLNTDGSVNDHDLTILLENWITSSDQPNSYYLGDIDGDGSIDFNDIEILYDHNDLTAPWLPADNP